MNRHLQTILNLIQQSQQLSDEEKTALSKAAKDADKELEIINFKLDRTEKVKRTTAILLEETIEELEQKRKAVEAKNKELEIETALERVRAVAMAMKQSDELITVCEVMYKELLSLGFTNIRNAQIAIENDARQSYLFYVYSDFEKITAGEAGYNSSPITQRLYNELGKSGDGLYEREYSPAEMEEWRNWRKSLSRLLDAREETAISLCWYIYAIGKGHIGISTFNQITKEQVEIVKRFKKVFELSYRRFDDLQKAEANTREAQIEGALERVRARAMAMHNSNDLSEAANMFFSELQHLGISPIRSGVGIISKESHTAQVYAASSWAGGNDLSLIGTVSLSGHPAFEQQYEYWLKQQNYFVALKEKELSSYYDILSAELQIPVNINVQPDQEQYGHWIMFPEGFVYAWSAEKKYSDSEIEILERFKKVISLTFRRYFELQKAETQAREAQIQAALEKVRSASLAMHRSDELKNVIILVFEKLKELGLVFQTAGIQLFTVGSKDIVQWVASPNLLSAPVLANLPYIEKDYEASEIIQDIWMAKEKRKSIYNKYYSFDEKNKFFEYAARYNNLEVLPEKAREAQMQAPGYTQTLVAGKDAALWVDSYSGQTISAEGFDVLERTAKVFEQAYTRFLDLQKAEAQTRESQIELSLERVRAKTMAMHNSTDVGETAAAMVDELKKLGIETIRCGIGIMHEPGDMEVWTISTDENKKTDIIIGWLDMNMHPLLHGAFESWRKKNEAYSYELKDEDLLNYYNAINNYPGYPIRYDTSNLPKLIHHNEFAFTEGILFAFSLQQLTDEQRKIFKRFAGVFGQTYRRYLDLKTAEAQAREATIEAALERVRSRTMMMQKSNELADTASLLFRQFKDLGYKPDRITIGIMQEEKQELELWATSGEANEQKQFYQLPFNEPHVLSKCVKAWKEQKKSLVLDLHGQPLKEYAEFWKSLSGTEDARSRVDEVIFNFAFFSKGYLGFISFVHVPPQTIELLERFAGVFDLTYTRFLDLKKAEAQAREAQIEAALERVRSKTLAMQKSDELREVVAVMYEQLQQLKFNEGACNITIMDEKSGDVDWWMSGYGNYKYPESYHVKYFNHPTHIALLSAWKSGKKFATVEMEGKIKKEYDEITFNQTDFKKLPEETKALLASLNKAIFSMATMKYGALVWADNAITNEHAGVLQRFAKVFEQTYTRFLDLQKAEAQAKEAQIEAALERVRSRTLAMQKSDELAETSAVLFKQLIGLGISPNRLYISIMKDDAGETEFWITDEDGSKVSMAYEDDLNNNSSFRKMYDGWKQQKKSLVIDMKGKELKEYLNHLISIQVPFKGGLKQKRRLQYVAYFSKGFIGMASPDEQPAETLQLLERFAYVFNLTFTRFNDLQIAEAHALQAEHDLIEIKTARTKAEETLAELQSTQKQLIQSEKMASLGELTAGIAHEIQNPLNFVNNFSEVSKELIDEMKAALEKGNKEEAEEIANDIIQNLEKINHHGRRADAIVKGMLQHSRKSSGQKEATDINALCDEYVRLCYHGLRAKDKSFNAGIVTDFDKSIQKINVTPQDISRVILNVLTNAFYAVNEKKTSYKLSAMNYEPTVSVQTKKLNDKIEIIVSDNGNGIPSNIIDKIFLPFFTTKPTGQGTGLGLSLAYDIITKEHNGNINVKSKEGEGTEFLITLPIIAVI